MPVSGSSPPAVEPSTVVSDKTESEVVAPSVPTEPISVPIKSKSNSSYYYFTVSLVVPQSTGVVEATTYAGLVYYEEKRVEDLVTFTAAKNLNALLQVSMC